MFEHEDNRGENAFHGPVRSVRVETVKISKQNNSYVEGPHILSRILTFDDARRKTEEINLGPDGSNVTKNNFTYDIKGRLTVVKQNNNGQFFNQTLYNYDAIGRLKMEINETADGVLLNKTIYTYDSHNNKTEVAHYDSDDSLITKLTSKFDDKGRIIETVFCGGRQSGGMLIRHHEQGRGMILIEKAQVPEADACVEGFLITRFVMSYDEKRKETAILQYKDDAALVSKLVFIGNDQSEEVEIIRYHADQSLQNKEKHMREFDAQANWTKDTKLFWNTKTDDYEPSEKTFRHFTY